MRPPSTILSLFTTVGVFTLPTAGQQSIVTPPELANIRTFGALARPFAETVVGLGSLMQQVEPALAGRRGRLTSMAFRRVLPDESYASRSFRARLAIAPSATTAASMSPVIAANRRPGSVPVIVFDGLLVFPARRATAASIPDFDTRIEFQVPYDLDGIDGIVWELAIANPDQVPDAQLYMGGPSEALLAGSFGQGCVMPGTGRPLSCDSGIDPAQWFQVLHGGRPGLDAVLMFGNAPIDRGYPIDLGLVGSPGCTLEFAPFAGMPMRLDGSGGAVVSMRNPFPAECAGAHFFTQWVVLDGRPFTSDAVDLIVPYNRDPLVGPGWPQAQVVAGTVGVETPVQGQVRRQGLIVQWGIDRVR